MDLSEFNSYLNKVALVKCNCSNEILSHLPKLVICGVSVTRRLNKTNIEEDQLNKEHPGTALMCNGYSMTITKNNHK